MVGIEIQNYCLHFFFDKVRNVKSNQKERRTGKKVESMWEKEKEAKEEREDVKKGREEGRKRGCEKKIRRERM